MRPFTHTITFDDARRLILAAVVPVDRTERLAIPDADGRVAAEDVLSCVDVPAFDRAAMDGYAVVATDTLHATSAAPAELVCVDRLFSGDVPRVDVRAGTCVEIATGAPLPEGATAVVMVEQTERAGDRVRVTAPVQAGQHIGRRGADVAHGTVTIRSGDELTPARIGALAAIGAADVSVYIRPTVAILSTGDEVAPQGRPLSPGQVYDVNSYTLSALVGRHGGAPARRAPASDSVEALADALRALAAHDVIVFSGGSSVGDRDLVRDAVGAAGEIVFHGIAVRPGKPTLFGRVGRALVFGMPGYPTSCLSNGYLLLVPAVRALARLPAWSPRTVDAPLGRRVASIAGRRQFYTVRLIDGVAEPAFKTSGDITSMAEADGYFVIPEEIESVEAGTVVTVTCF